jgi:uncharacterized protein YqgV (UPF0045/DUF77 family)
MSGDMARGGKVILAVGAASLAPHAVTIPGVVITIDVDDRTDDEIKVIQEKG